MARQIADRRARRDADGNWVWPPIAEALEIAGLHPIEEYIQRRQATILARVVDRPYLCQMQGGVTGDGAD